MVGDDIYSWHNDKIKRLEARIAELEAVVEPLDELRNGEDEGVSLFLSCDDREADGGGCRVSVMAAWSDYGRGVVFEGSNLGEALANAVAARDAKGGA